MPLRDWFSRRTPLQLALERGIAPGGNLFDELRRLGEYKVESKADALAICDALTRFERGQLSLEGWKAFSSLVRLFQEVEDRESPAFDVLSTTGIEILISILNGALDDAARFDLDDILSVLRILALYASRSGTDAVIQAAKADLKPDSYSWQTVFRCFSKDHPETARLFKALGSAPPPNFIGVSLLDCANSVLIDGGDFLHPFDTPTGRERLESWLTDRDEDHHSYAVSAAAALPFIRNPDRDRLLAIAFDHPSAEVQIEAAWVGAKLGRDAAVKLLGRLCLDVNYGQMTQRYLAEVNRQDAIPDAANESDFKAKANFADWLRHPCELGRPPDEVEIVDSRILCWPPDQEQKRLWLVRYRLRDATGLNDDDAGVGLVGSITFCFFAYELDQRTPEDCYAIHCFWEMKQNKLISQMDIEGASSDFDHLLDEHGVTGITDACLIEAVELDAKLDYPQRLVCLARAKRFGELGWIVLDGTRTSWYPASDMPRDQAEKVVTQIHIGRELLGFGGETERKRWLRNAMVKRAPAEIIVAYERNLRETLAIGSESWRLTTQLSLLSRAFDDYVESLVAEKGFSKNGAVTSAYETLLAAAASVPSKVCKKWRDSFSPVGANFETYVDALIAEDRRNELPGLIEGFRDDWNHNMGHKKLGAAAFKGGFDELAEPFLLKLRNAGKNWWRCKEVAFLADVWHRRANDEHAKSLLIEAMRGLLQEIATATGSERKTYQETLDSHRSRFLTLFRSTGEQELREAGVPPSDG